MVCVNYMPYFLYLKRKIINQLIVSKSWKIFEFGCKYVENVVFYCMNKKLMGDGVGRDGCGFFGEDIGESV